VRPRVILDSRVWRCQLRIGGRLGGHPATARGLSRELPRWSEPQYRLQRIICRNDQHDAADSEGRYAHGQEAREARRTVDGQGQEPAPAPRARGHADGVTARRLGRTEGAARLHDLGGVSVAVAPDADARGVGPSQESRASFWGQYAQGIRSWGIIALGMLHMASTPRALTPSAVWFFSGGIAMVLTGALNLLSRTYGGTAPGLRWFCIATNAAMTVFALVAGSVGRASVGQLVVIVGWMGATTAFSTMGSGGRAAGKHDAV